VRLSYSHGAFPIEMTFLRTQAKRLQIRPGAACFNSPHRGMLQPSYYNVVKPKNVTVPIHLQGSYRPG
jgi:hypothetical protein